MKTETNIYSKKNFNDNLFELCSNKDTIYFSCDERKDYVKYLLRLHTEDRLVDFIERSLNFYNEISINESGL